MANGTSKEQQVALATAYLEDLGRIGGRHETARAYYLSVVSALTVFLSLAGEDGLFVSMSGPVLVMVGFAGVVICVTWFIHMRFFQKLFGAKLETVRRMEEELPLKPFTAELELLKGRATTEAERGDGYLRFTAVDFVVPWVFVALFAAFVYIKLMA